MDGTLGDKVLKGTAFLHLRSLASLLLAIILGFIFVIWTNFDSDAIFIMGIFLLVDAIPVLYLHTEYWIKNRGEKYKIIEGRIIRYNKRGKKIYNKENIVKIILYKSASIDKGGIPILAIESYHYARVIMRTGDELIITCLLTPKVDKAIQKLGRVTIQRKKRGFCPIFWR